MRENGESERGKSGQQKTPAGAGGLGKTGHGDKGSGGDGYPVWLLPYRYVLIFVPSVPEDLTNWATYRIYFLSYVNKILLAVTGSPISLT